MDEAKEVDVTIESLRKPEVRTPYTQAVLAELHQYYGEVLKQKDHPIVAEFSRRKGVLFPVGSLLRGTARPGFSDIDLVTLYDSENHPPLSYQDLWKLTIDGKEYHPDKVSFEQWVAQRFKQDESLRPFYDERRRYLEEVIPTENNEVRKLQGLPPLEPKKVTDERLEKYFLSLDNTIVDTHVIAKQISALASLSQEDFDSLSSSTERHEILSGKTYDNFASTMGAVVPFLLTSTTDFSVESSPGTLEHHQRKLVKALSFLERQNPYVFERVYRILSTNFKAGTIWESVRHSRDAANYYNNLLVDYIRNSGRFKPNQEERTLQILSSIKKGTKFPSLVAFRKKFGLETAQDTLESPASDIDPKPVTK